MARTLEIKFEFPPIHGTFDAGNGIVYMFGETHESEIGELIEHETLHYVLKKVAGKRASLKLDNIYLVLKKDEKH